MDEFELIADLFAPLATGPGALGLTDDASLIQIPQSQEAVVTTDTLVEGVHFPAGTDPRKVAQKLLRVNLSDLAAMGAAPLGYWLGVQVTKDGARDWLAKFVEGLRADQTVLGITLMGGDTVTTPGPVALSLTAMGTVPTGGALLRSGAKPGDRIFVSGTIGDGALGLKAARGECEALDAGAKAYLIDRLECPTPRLSLGQSLRGHASAAIDVSDGLVADAWHIAGASNARLVIDADRVPFSPQARAALEGGGATLEELLTGGDDYELLFTMPPGAAVPQGGDVAVTEVGEVAEGEGVRVMKGGKELQLARRGFTHL